MPTGIPSPRAALYPDHMKVSTSTEGRVRSAELTGVAPRTMRDTWEIVSDTSRLNEVVFGMPPLSVLDFNSLSARAAISLPGFSAEYEEQAWEYEAPSRFRSVRIFTSGPLVRLESVCVLSAEGDGTRVVFSLRLTAKEGPLGFGAAKLLMPKLEDGLGKLGAVLSSPHQTLRSIHRPAREAETRARRAVSCAFARVVRRPNRECVARRRRVAPR